MTVTLSSVKNFFHACIAPLGAIAGANAVVVTLLTQVGVTAPDMRASQLCGAAGALAALLSMMTDSRHDAVVQVATLAASPVAPPPAPPVIQG